MRKCLITASKTGVVGINIPLLGSGLDRFDFIEDVFCLLLEALSGFFLAWDLCEVWIQRLVSSTNVGYCFQNYGA